MTDEEYLFNITSKERKSTGRGAYYKKGGSKSKKCSLPSDYLTPSQLKKRSGDMETYNLSKPMTWEEFRKVPNDLQSQYLKKLSDMGAGTADVCEMFGTNTNNFGVYMQKHHKGEHIFPRTRKSNYEFMEWRHGVETKKVVEEVEDLQVPFEPLEINCGTLTYTGDPRMVFEKVLLSMDTSRPHRITVMFEVAQ